MASGKIAKNDNINLNLTAHPYFTVTEVRDGVFFCLDFAASKDAYIAGNFIRIAFNTVAAENGTTGVQHWVNGVVTSDKWINKS